MSNTFLKSILNAIDLIITKLDIIEKDMLTIHKKIEKLSNKNLIIEEL